MPFMAIGQYASAQDLDETGTLQKLPLGTTVKAKMITDSTHSDQMGDGEFIYLLGVASTVAYDLCYFLAETYQTVRAVANGVGVCGWANSANVASQYGWYQIAGPAEANVAAGFAAGAVPYLTATTAVVDDAVVAGDKVYNSISLTAIATPVAGNAYIHTAYPFVTNESN